MATEVKAEIQAPKATRDRSPAYPFISLKGAVDRLATLEAYFGRHPIGALKAGLAWGMKPESSQAGQTLASLKAYGFVDYQGAGEARVAILTEDGRNYIRAQQDSIKKEILRRSALKPKAISQYWQKWGADRLPDPICIDELVMKGGFSDTGAPVFLKVYDETIAFAGLSHGDKMDVAADADDDATVAPPSAPPSGAPMNTQVTTSHHATPPIRQPVAGIRQDTFTLDEGQAVLQWPERLCADSFEDFESWIQLQLKKIKRSIVQPDAPLQ